MYLHLRDYSLSGKLPLSLTTCQYLITLDLGENKLTGRIPTWLGTEFNYMSILRLRGNNFHGHMPEDICYSDALQILDLADNNLSSPQLYQVLRIHGNN
ncbi:Receptor-like protein EIX2 [Euphorbia peplus]|nr:Receptor-like protein EIX2 [Euphorbia peplus]